MDIGDMHFDWPRRIRPFFFPGFSSCLEEGRLTVDGVRLAATWIDVYALRLAEWAVAHRRSLILCPREPFGPLAALTAAAAHVWSMALHYKATGEALGSDLRVAVVTQNLRMRGIYRRLGVGTAKLFDVVPAAMRSRTGYVSILGRDPGRGWSTIFLSRPSEVLLLDNIDLAVIELPIPGEEEIETLKVPVILIAHDPTDHRLVRLVGRFPMFAWDDDDLRQLPAIAVGDGRALIEARQRLERVAAGVRFTPIAIPAHQISENAALFWEDIGPLVRAGTRSLLSTELASAAFVLFYDLMHLAIPTSYYEAATRPLRARLSELARAQRLAQGDLRDLYVPMVTAELRDLAAAIGTESPKTAALLLVLRQHVDHGHDVLLVARTAELARIYATYLAEFPALRGAVRVTNIWGIPTQRPADVAVFVGLMPTSARYLYTTGLAAEIIALAYDAESQLESVPGGFTECNHVRTAVAYQREYAEWLARDAAKATCWERLSGESVEIHGDRPVPPRAQVQAIVLGQLPPPPDTPPGLWDAPFGVFSKLEERIDRGTPPQFIPPSDGDAGPLEVEALRIEFTDSRWMLLEVDANVTKFLASGTPEAGYRADRIAPGDRIVFLDGEAKKDLLDKVLEVAAELPEFAVPAAWIDYWRQALRHAYRRFGSYEALAAALRGRGCVRQTQTVRLWVVGQTIGPEDSEDIRRVGECLDDMVLVSNYLTINAAIESLRHAHMALGQRLGALARHVGRATVAGLIGEDEIIDQRTGLTTSDFRDSMEVLTVRAVHHVGKVPYAVTGRLRGSDEEGVEIV